MTRHPARPLLSLALAAACVLPAGAAVVVGGVLVAPTAAPSAAAALEAVPPSRTADPGEVVAARAVLADPRGLEVADDVLVGDGSGYDRDARFGRWPSIGGGCDLRDRVLTDELTDLEVRPDRRCDVTGGSLDGVHVDGDEVDVDHVVPLRLAWSSGAAGWDDQRRRALASDRLNLRVERAGSNRGDGAAGPESSPPAPVGDHVARCRYGVAFVLVADGYRLTVTPGRRAALEDLVAECPA